MQPSPHVANSSKLSCDYALYIIWTTIMHGKVEFVTKKAFLSLVQVFVSSGSLYTPSMIFLLCDVVFQQESSPRAACDFVHH